MRGTGVWAAVLAASLAAGCGLPGGPTVPGGPGGGPPEGPPTVVTATVSASCNGGPASDLSFDLTVPTWVRAGRPFPVEVASTEFPLPDGVASHLGLSVTGASVTDVTVAMEDPTYLVAASAPGQDVTLAITTFDVFDPAQLFSSSCTVEAPAAVATVRVRHAAPFAEASLTAEQRVGILCLSYPGGRLSSVYTQDVSITVPNQVHEGEPFPIAGPAVSVVGGVRSGDTITPTGAPGETVEFSFDGSYTQYAPPPYPPIPVTVCQQSSGAVHLASVPILAR